MTIAMARVQKQKVEHHWPKMVMVDEEWTMDVVDLTAFGNSAAKKETS